MRGKARSERSGPRVRVVIGADWGDRMVMSTKSQVMRGLVQRRRQQEREADGSTRKAPDQPLSAGPGSGRQC